jgi:hypothetical protein
MTKNFTQPLPVEVEIAGQNYFGSYTVEGGVVTARWNGWTDSTQSGAAGTEIIAKSLIRGLVRRYKDAD